MGTSTGKSIIAIDVMGGDKGSISVIKGANIVAKKAENVHFLLYGDENEINDGLKSSPHLAKMSTIVHVSEVVGHDDKPSTAIRRGRGTSMGQAIGSVRSKAAHAVVSSGNTGALMAMSKIMLGMLPGIERPAIGGIMPQRGKRSVMLDVGANIGATADNLFDFAVMGHAYACSVLKKDNPSIGVLNIGSEDIKGHETVQSAVALINESDLPLNFLGYVEGNDICGGDVDVIVTDGFTGNIALKTVEGTAQMFLHYLKSSLNSDPLAWIGRVLCYPALRKLKKQMDPRNYNGAMFLGLNGVVVKSHGGSDAKGNANAIQMAVDLVQNDINKTIIDEMIDSGHIPPDEFTPHLAISDQSDD